MKEFGRFQPKRDVFAKIPLLKSHGAIEKIRQNDCKKQNGWVNPKKPCPSATTGWYTYELLETMAACTYSSKTGSQY